MSFPIFIPAPPRKYKERKLAGSATTPVGPLTLVSASYQPGDTVTLVFNQPIDLLGLDGGSFVVEDPNFNTLYQGLGEVDLLDPSTVRIGLQDAGSPTAVSVTLVVGPGNGLRPLGGGAVWSGVTVELPFP